MMMEMLPRLALTFHHLVRVSHNLYKLSFTNTLLLLGGSSSGVSSVRGSVNSVSQHEGAGASIDVSDIQVTDD